MLNPFPHLLTYSFYAPTLLRVAVACVFVFLAAKQYENRSAILRIQYPLLRGSAVLYMALTIDVLIAIAMLIGFYTQYAAIAGIILALAAAAQLKRDGALFPLTRSTSLLLFVICLSLLLSGAGAMALDVRL